VVDCHIYFSVLELLYLYAPSLSWTHTHTLSLSSCIHNTQQATKYGTTSRHHHSPGLRRRYNKDGMTPYTEAATPGHWLSDPKLVAVISHRSGGCCITFDYNTALFDLHVVVFKTILAHLSIHVTDFCTFLKVENVTSLQPLHTAQSS